MGAGPITPFSEIFSSEGFSYTLHTLIVHVMGSPACFFVLQVFVTAVSLVTTLSAFSSTSSQIWVMAVLQRAFYLMSLRMGQSSLLGFLWAWVGYPRPLWSLPAKANFQGSACTIQ